MKALTENGFSMVMKTVSWKRFHRNSRKEWKRLQKAFSR